jgi:hypothetical protein
VGRKVIFNHPIFDECFYSMLRKAGTPLITQSMPYPLRQLQNIAETVIIATTVNPGLPMPEWRLLINDDDQWIDDPPNWLEPVSGPVAECLEATIATSLRND